MKKYPTILERKSISEPTIKNMTGKQKYNRCLWKGFIFVYFYAVRIYKRLGCRPPSRMSKSFHFHSVLTTKKKTCMVKYFILVTLYSNLGVPFPFLCSAMTEPNVWYIIYPLWHSDTFNKCVYYHIQQSEGSWTRVVIYWF